MATLKKFAIQQVLNLLLRRPADKSIVAYLDNLKTSGLENTMEMVYPTGGRGNLYIGMGFAHSKRATLNVQVATWNTEVMAAQNGTEVTTGETEVIEYDVISYISGEGWNTKFVALGKENEEIGYIYILNADGTQGKAYIQSSSLLFGDTEHFLYNPATKNISFSLNEQQVLKEANVKLCCAYRRMTTGDDATRVSLKGTSIPSVVLVTGYGVVVDICSNIAYLCQFNGKAQIDGNYTFDLSADGDPSVQSLNLEFVRDCGVEELYSFIIYDEEGEGSGGGTPIPPTPPTPPAADLDFDVDYNALLEPDVGGIMNLQTDYELDADSTYTVVVTIDTNGALTTQTYNNLVVEGDSEIPKYIGLFSEGYEEGTVGYFVGIYDNFKYDQTMTPDNGYMCLEIMDWDSGAIITHLSITKE